MNNNIVRLAISDEGFVFDPQTGKSFIVNNTGKQIIQKLSKNEDESKIAQEISDEYDISQSQAKADIRDFIESLRAYKIS